jgi:hypothetical protein
VQAAAEWARDGIGSMIVSQNLAWHLVLRLPGEIDAGLWRAEMKVAGDYLLTHRRRKDLPMPGLRSRMTAAWELAKVGLAMGWTWGGSCTGNASPD